jgi:dihydropyrimidinase
MGKLMYDTVITGGLLVTASETVLADVAIEGERIVAVGLGLEGERIIDATGCYVLPGGVDAHVHLQMWVGRYRSSDTFTSGTVAAALGGTTTVVDFVEPRDGQPMMAALAERRQEADAQVATDYGLHMTVPAWHADHALQEVPAVMEAGIHSFKLYQAYGRLRLDDAHLYKVLRTMANCGGLPILHSENGPVIDLLREGAIRSGHTEPIWHARTRPAVLEGQAVAGAVRLAQLAGSAIYIVHVSCAEAAEAVADARRRGEPVFAETCPQYLFLTEHSLAAENGQRFVCAPPLRSESDQTELWQALALGDLQVISTDHCPFMAAEKAAERAFTQIPGGLPSIEARLSLIHDAARRGLLTLNQWADRCCTQPASMFRLPRKGHVAPGYDADLVVFDPEQEVTLSAKRLHEQVDWTPYEGVLVRGWPRHVLSRGEQIVRDGEFVGKVGRGRFLRAG